MSLVFTFFSSLWNVATNLVVALFSGLLLLAMIVVALGIAAFVASIVLKTQKKKDSVKKRL